MMSLIQILYYAIAIGYVKMGRKVVVAVSLQQQLELVSLSISDSDSDSD